MYSDALMLNCMLKVRYQLFSNRATSFIKNTDYFNRLICFCLHVRITTESWQAPDRFMKNAIVCCFMFLLQNTDKVMATVENNS